MPVSPRPWRLLAVLPLVLSVSACTFFAMLRWDRIELSTAQVTFAWDPPEAAADSVPISSYRIYFRTHRAVDWTLLAEVTASDAPEYTATASTLPAGTYDFAVSSVGVNGLESVLHSSLDETADPPTGWFLLWTPTG
jgi:hypothetical protein